MNAHVTAGLTASNLSYRHPDLYDRMQAGGGTAEICARLVDEHAAAMPRSVLDLGFGTGRELAYLAAHLGLRPGGGTPTTVKPMDAADQDLPDVHDHPAAAVGVDVQPVMVAYARKARPSLDVRVGDVRTVRLGRCFDLVVCLGNVLAYLHANEDVAAALRTFAAHTRPGALLVLSTMVDVSPDARPSTGSDGSVGAPASGLVEVEGFRATVTVERSWELRTQVETMRRRWHLEDGTVEDDLIRRRVLFPMELAGCLSRAGFDLLTIRPDSGRREAALTGPTAWIVARRR